MGKRSATKYIHIGWKPQREWKNRIASKHRPYFLELPKTEWRAKVDFSNGSVFPVFPMEMLSTPKVDPCCCPVSGHNGQVYLKERWLFKCISLLEQSGRDGFFPLFFLAWNHSPVVGLQIYTGRGWFANPYPLLQCTEHVSPAIHVSHALAPFLGGTSSSHGESFVINNGNYN